MTALLILLWLLAGAVCSFGFLVTVHKHSRWGIDADDKLWAFVMFLCFPIALVAGLMYFAVRLINRVVYFIEEKF